jgi:hypothetical protein
MSSNAKTIAVWTILGALVGCVPAVAIYFYYVITSPGSANDGQLGLGVAIFVVIGAPPGSVVGLIAGIKHVKRK